MANKYREINRQLPELSTDELMRVKNKAAFLLKSRKTQKKTAVPDDPNLVSLYEAMKKTLEKELNTSYPPLPVLASDQKIYPALLNGSEEVEQWMDHNLPKIKRVERQRIYLLVTRSIINHLRQRGIMVSLNTVVHHLKYIDSIMDAAFPGYAASGLMQKIIRGGKVDR